MQCALKYSLDEGETPLYFQPKRREITIWINQTVCVVIKRTKTSTTIILKNGNKTFRLPSETFEILCDFQQCFFFFLISFFENQQSGNPTRSDTNLAVQLQKQARSVCVFAHIDCWFSDAAAHLFTSSH